MAIKTQPTKSFEQVSAYFEAAKDDRDKLDRIRGLLRTLTEKSDAKTAASLLGSVDMTTNKDLEVSYGILRAQLEIVTSNMALEKSSKW